MGVVKIVPDKKHIVRSFLKKMPQLRDLTTNTSRYTACSPKRGGSNVSTKMFDK